MQPRLGDSSILHRCDGDPEGCMCVYDPTCTGKFGKRMLRLPVWLSALLSPRRTAATFRARWVLKRAGKWRG